jgi:FeS assembly SUF system protein
MPTDEHLLAQAEEKDKRAAELEDLGGPERVAEAQRLRGDATRLKAEWRARQSDCAGLEELVVETLRTCFDPEIPVNIYDLGLIYEVKAAEDGVVRLRMTLTSPNCPVAGYLPGEVEGKVRGIPGVTDVNFELVWDPPWNTGMMSEEAKLQLGMM